MSYRSTKARFHLLAVGLLLWAAPAFAQQLPFTLPANTVVGRTSIGPGQATAITFAELVSQLSQFGLVQSPLTLSEFPTIGANTVLGSVAGGTPAALSSTQLTAMINGATSSLSGVVKPDGTTIIVNGSGALTAVGATSIDAAGATSISNGAHPGGLLFNNAGKVGNGSSPWCDMVAQGATGAAAADDAAWSACMAALPGGGRVFFSGGTFCTTAGFTTTIQRIEVFGVGRFATILDACGTNVGTASIGGAQSYIHDLTVNGTNSLTASNPALSLPSSSVETVVNNVVIEYGSTPLFNDAIDSVVDNTKVIYPYGSALVLNRAGNHWKRGKFDQPWPVSTPANHSLTVAAWPASTSVTLGEVVSLGGFYIQCSHAGTTGSSAPTLQTYTNTITDNTAQWLLAGVVNSSAFDSDTGGGSVSLFNVDMTGATTQSFAMTNSLAGSAPVQILLTNVTGAAVSTIFDLAAGAGVSIVNSIANDCNGTGCVGIETTGSWVSDLTVSSTLVVGNSTGIFLNAGTNTIISGNPIVGNSSNGVLVNAGISNFIVSVNTLGSSATYGGTGTALTVLSGASNHYNIVNNIVAGATTGVSDSGSGANKTVSGNN